MPFAQRPMATAIVAALATLTAGADDPKPITSDLPGPFGVKREEVEAGNPLARYVELLRRRERYLESPMWKTMYPELLLMFEEFLGDPDAGPKGMAWMLGDRKEGPTPEASPLDDCKPEDAATAILAAVGDRRAVIVGEEHHLPQTRSLIVPLLRGLREKGFRYFAVETFYHPATPTQEAGYPTSKTGTYTEDPVFGDAVREAVRLGFTLVAYEALPGQDVPAERRQEFRESGQARNLKDRIFDKDQQARAFIWVGRGHAKKGAIGGDTMMAAHFQTMTGLDPFTVLASRNAEGLRPELEAPLYRYATGKGLVTRPTVFLKKDGTPYSEFPGFDATVFFPRVKVVNGRPDWMVRDLGRTAYPLPEALLKGQGLKLAQARYAGEPDKALPVDQVLIRPDRDVPALMLPKGKFRVRVIDEDGKIAGPVEVEI